MPETLAEQRARIQAARESDRTERRAAIGYNQTGETATDVLEPVKTPDDDAAPQLAPRSARKAKSKQ